MRPQLLEKFCVGFCHLRCIVGHTKKKEGDIVEDVQLVHALQTRQDGAMEQFQTAYIPSAAVHHLSVLHIQEDGHIGGPDSGNL